MIQYRISEDEMRERVKEIESGWERERVRQRWSEREPPPRILLVHVVHLVTYDYG